EEGNYIRSYFGEPANVMVAGNFPNKIPLLPTQEKSTGSLKLISIGLISPMKNILMVLQALEPIAFSIEYDIYGSVKDEEYWDLCKEQIKKLPANITTTFHNEIEPPKVKDALAEAHVFILPSKSENFGHAIFEALSAGRPVITSNNTPWNHLKESDAGRNVSIENNSELTDAIAFFAAMNQEEMEKWSVAAHHYSEEALDLEKIKEEYKEMFVFS
ncbi:MAG: glycosyltransferase family 4 protein, partial [Ginsengibacter sp.]